MAVSPKVEYKLVWGVVRSEMHSDINICLVKSVDSQYNC